MPASRRSRRSISSRSISIRPINSRPINSRPISGALALLTITLLIPALFAPAAPASAAATPVAAQARRVVDVQAHRGGRGLVVENTLPAFANALALGVSTLELDVHISQDGHAVVTHDRKVSAAKCRDTGPATTGDREYPYVGRYVKNLTVKQLRTLDCGSVRQAGFSRQKIAAGARIPLLRDVFALAARHRADTVRFDIELKVQADEPQQTAPRERFVQVVVAEIRRAGVVGRTSVASFDWGAVRRVGQVEPRLHTVALTSGDHLGVGRPGGSPWLDGRDADRFGGDVVLLARLFRADALGQVHGETTPALVRRAHAARLTVLPWTVNDRPAMRRLLDAGVDGIVTDRPDLLRSVLAERGLPLPRKYPAPRS